MSKFTPDLFNRIQALYSQLLIAANQSSSNVNCSINIGSILGDLNDNCIVNIKNVCRSENDSLSILDLAVSTVFGILDGTDSGSTALAEMYNQFRQECLAESQLIQSISIQNINLGVCKPRIRTELNFINSGDAVSNCVVSSMLRISQEDPVIEEVGLAKTIQDNFIYIAIAILGCSALSMALLIFYRQKLLIVWRKT